MHCRNQHLTAPTRLADPTVRVGDADREAVASLLAAAAAGGFLSMPELDQRLSHVWSAATRGDLTEVSEDLPPELGLDRARRHTVAEARAVARKGWVPHLASYLAVMLLLVAIWLMVGLGGGSWYPWPVWPALGWGIGLCSHARMARAESSL
jgi:hypothetical protein